ncbi:N-glycosylase/DNA lyase [Fopius arisanus]|uniref:DNA-(apurinic or apyrimidinic site) lyase n=1 Tax=Fopius arisanus TaxID=64838 RepID=A0A0C9RSJ7_9HYME|nr:PREDICTED: N-glycosylase/DNA lyase [Fopius arisanus]
MNNMSKSAKTVLKIFSGTVPCDVSELDLGITLKGGQSFRWKEIPENKYRGVFASSIWTLHQDSSQIFFTVHTSSLKSSKACKEQLEKYFRLDLSLRDNLIVWCSSDPKFSRFSSQVRGVRILDQNPTENLFSFICSANNHITRITKMIERMCENYGRKIGEVDGENYFDFPKIEDLSQEEVPQVLAKEGFGYRAKYIGNSAKKLMELGGIEFLESLHRYSGISYDDARKKLMVLPGVGPKVADCICLMSLGHLEAIPVDTHIYQVAKETYLPGLKKFSTSSGVYGEINRFFRDTWGSLAGWAQAIVFCSRIKSQERTGEDLEAQGPVKKTRKK